LGSNGEKRSSGGNAHFMNESQKQAYQQWKARKEKLPALEGQVLKIQSLWRGYVVRKRLLLIKSIFLNGTEGGIFDPTIDSAVLFKHEQIKVRSPYRFS